MEKKRLTLKQTLLYLLITLIVLFLISPYVWMVINTFRGTTETFASSVIPHTWTLQNYANVMRNADTLHSILNSSELSQAHSHCRFFASERS